MDEQTRKDLIDQLYFGREAAQYLGVTMQRLEELVGDGQLSPVKRSPGEMIFLRDDLDGCRTHRPKPKKKIIHKEEIDLRQPHLQKAVNYFALRCFCQGSDQIAEPIFLRAVEKTHLTRPIEEIGAVLANALDISEEAIIMKVRQIRQSFKTLERDDLVIDRDAEEYPSLMRSKENAPAYLFLRGDAGLLKETIVAMRDRNHLGTEISEKAARLARALENAGVVTASAGRTEGERAVLEHGHRPILAAGTPLPDEAMQRQDELLGQVGERGLIVSILPPPLSESGTTDPAAAETILSALSLAALDLESDRTDGEMVSRLQEYLIQAVKKNMIDTSGKRARIFSKGIRAEYVYNIK